MERNLMKRKRNAQMYVAAYTKSIRAANKVIRKDFDAANKHHDIIGYWDHVFFTDEAHYNPLEPFQKPRVLRKEALRWC
jgi:hypothetical protein